MPVFKTRIRRITGLTFSPFSAEDMSQIGSAWLSSALARIRSGKDITNSPARPLQTQYRAAKTGEDGRGGRRVVGSGAGKFKGKGIRDWTLRGWTLASAKVKVASQESVTIGFTTEQANKIVSGLRQRPGGDMWGECPSDTEAAQRAMLPILRRHLNEQLTHYGPPGVYVGNKNLRGGSSIGGEFL